MRAFSIGCAALLAASWAGAAARPNIVFIMSDDHAEQAISAYGSRLIETPNIDRLAREGMLFRNAFVTNSICAPSRAVLLTGKYSHLNGLRDNRDEFDGSQMTFPKLLQGQGYQTGIVGKWHLKSAPTGFDHWKILVGQGYYYRPVFLDNGEPVELEGYATDLITDHALEFLQQRDPDKPFLLLYHHKAPHRNWMPATRHLNLYNDRELPLPETFWDDYRGRLAAQRADMRIADMFLSSDMKLRPAVYGEETGSGGGGQSGWDPSASWESSRERLTEEELAAWDAHYGGVNREYAERELEGRERVEWMYQRYMKDYLRTVVAVDEGVGRVLDYLDANGLTENTIVVYTSDQGFYLGEHGWYDKRFMYEESLSTPLLVRVPGAEAGAVNEELVLNLDFAPTFLDYAGMEIPEEMQGRSLRPILEGEAPADWRDAIYYHYYEYPHGWHSVQTHYGVRTDRYKLIRFYGDVDAWELFDLESDPNELENRYGDPAMAQVQAELRRRLEELRRELGDSTGAALGG